MLLPKINSFHYFANMGVVVSQEVVFPVSHQLVTHKNVNHQSSGFLAFWWIPTQSPYRFSVFIYYVFARLLVYRQRKIKGSIYWITSRIQPHRFVVEARFKLHIMHDKHKKGTNYVSKIRFIAYLFLNLLKKPNHHCKTGKIMALIPPV